MATSEEGTSESDSGSELDNENFPAEDLRVVYQVDPQNLNNNVQQPPLLAPRQVAMGPQDQLGPHLRPRYKLPLEWQYHVPQPRHVKMVPHKAKKKRKHREKNGCTGTSLLVVILVLAVLAVAAETITLVLYAKWYNQSNADNNLLVKQQLRLNHSCYELISNITHEKEVYKVRLDGVRQAKSVAEEIASSICVRPPSNVSQQECQKDLNEAQTTIDDLRNDNNELQMSLNNLKVEQENVKSNFTICEQELASMKHTLKLCQDRVTEDTNCETQLHACQSKTCVGFSL